MIQQNEVAIFLSELFGKEQRVLQLREAQNTMKETDAAYVMSNIFGGHDGIYFTVGGVAMADLVEEEIKQAESQLVKDREKYAKLLAIVADGPAA